MVSHATQLNTIPDVESLQKLETALELTEQRIAALDTMALPDGPLLEYLKGAQALRDLIKAFHTKATDMAEYVHRTWPDVDLDPSLRERLVGLSELLTLLETSGFFAGEPS